jgi:hypothetical protein
MTILLGLVVMVAGVMQAGTIGYIIVVVGCAVVAFGAYCDDE